MINNFPACDAFTVPAEGGLSMDATDPGNWTGGKVGVGTLAGTKYGIAAADHPGVNIAGLTPAGAAAIRQAGYWTPINGDALPAGVDLMCYDESVNAGDSRSAKILQGVLGLVQDGDIGPVTTAKLATVDATATINALAAAQAAFYRSLPLFARDGGGWLARLERRQMTALAMVLVVAPAPVHESWFERI